MGRGAAPTRRRRSGSAAASGTSATASPQSGTGRKSSAGVPTPSPSSTSRRRRGSGATNATPTAQAAHEADADALDRGLSMLEGFLRRLRRRDGVSASAGASASASAPASASLDISDSTPDRDFRSSDALSVMTEVIDERRGASLEYTLGVLGADKLPGGLVERQRSMGARAYNAAWRNQSIRRKREANERRKAAEREEAKRKAREKELEKQREAERALAKKREDERKERARRQAEAEKAKTAAAAAAAAKKVVPDPSIATVTAGASAAEVASTNETEAIVKVDTAASIDASKLEAEEAQTETRDASTPGKSTPKPSQKPSLKFATRKSPRINPAKTEKGAAQDAFFVRGTGRNASKATTGSKTTRAASTSTKAEVKSVAVTPKEKGGSSVTVTAAASAAASAPTTTPSAVATVVTRTGQKAIGMDLRTAVKAKSANVVAGAVSTAKTLNDAAKASKTSCRGKEESVVLPMQTDVEMKDAGDCDENKGAVISTEAAEKATEEASSKGEVSEAMEVDDDVRKDVQKMGVMNHGREDNDDAANEQSLEMARKEMAGDKCEGSVAKESRDVSKDVSDGMAIDGSAPDTKPSGAESVEASQKAAQHIVVSKRSVAPTRSASIAKVATSAQPSTGNAARAASPMHPQPRVQPVAPPAQAVKTISPSPRAGSKPIVTTLSEPERLEMEAPPTPGDTSAMRAIASAVAAASAEVQAGRGETEIAETGPRTSSTPVTTRRETSQRDPRETATDVAQKKASLSAGATTATGERACDSPADSLGTAAAQHANTAKAPHLIRPNHAQTALVTPKPVQQPSQPSSTPPSTSVPSALSSVRPSNPSPTSASAVTTSRPSPALVSPPLPPTPRVPPPTGKRSNPPVATPSPPEASATASAMPNRSADVVLPAAAKPALPSSAKQTSKPVAPKPPTTPAKPEARPSQKLATPAKPSISHPAANVAPAASTSTPAVTPSAFVPPVKQATAATSSLSTRPARSSPPVKPIASATVTKPVAQRNVSHASPKVKRTVPIYKSIVKPKHHVSVHSSSKPHESKRPASASTPTKTAATASQVPTSSKLTTAATKPVPVAVKPAPVGAKPAPVTVKPVSVSAKPASVTVRPAPAGAKPAPIAVKSVPSIAQPASVTGKSASTGAKPAPVAVKSLSATSKPRAAVAKSTPGITKEEAVTAKQTSGTAKQGPAGQKLPSAATAKQTSVVTKRTPVAAKPIPVATKSGSSAARTIPVTTKAASIVPKSSPIPTRPGPATARPGPVSTTPVSASAKQGLGVAKVGPVTTKPVPLAVKPIAVVAKRAVPLKPGIATSKSAPVAARSTSFAAKAAPVATKSPSVAAKAAPVTTKAAPVAAKVTPGATKASAVATKASPIAAKAAPVATKASPIAAKAAPVAAKATPVVAKTAPVVANTAVTGKTATVIGKASPVAAKSGPVATKSVSVPVKQAPALANSTAIAAKSAQTTAKATSIAAKSTSVAAKVAPVAVSHAASAKNSTHLTPRPVRSATASESLAPKTKPAHAAQSQPQPMEIETKEPGKTSIGNFTKSSNVAGKSMAKESTPKLQSGDPKPSGTSRESVLVKSENTLSLKPNTVQQASKNAAAKATSTSKVTRVSSDAKTDTKITSTPNPMTGISKPKTERKSVADTTSVPSKKGATVVGNDKASVVTPSVREGKTPPHVSSASSRKTSLDPKKQKTKSVAEISKSALIGKSEVTETTPTTSVKKANLVLTKPVPQDSHEKESSVIQKDPLKVPADVNVTTPIQAVSTPVTEKIKGSPSSAKVPIPQPDASEKDGKFSKAKLRKASAPATKESTNRAEEPNPLVKSGTEKAEQSRSAGKVPATSDKSDSGVIAKNTSEATTQAGGTDLKTTKSQNNSAKEGLSVVTSIGDGAKVEKTTKVRRKLACKDSDREPESKEMAHIQEGKPKDEEGKMEIEKVPFRVDPVDNDTAKTEAETGTAAEDKSEKLHDTMKFVVNFEKNSEVKDSVVSVNSSLPENTSKFEKAKSTDKNLEEIEPNMQQSKAGKTEVAKRAAGNDEEGLTEVPKPKPEGTKAKVVKHAGKSKEVKSEAPKAEAVKAKLSTANLVKPAEKPDSVKPNTAKPDATKAKVVKSVGTSEAAISEATKPKATKIDSTNPEVTSPQTTKPEVTKPEVVKPGKTATKATSSEFINPNVGNVDMDEIKDEMSNEDKPDEEPNQAKQNDNDEAMKEKSIEEESGKAKVEKSNDDDSVAKKPEGEPKNSLTGTKRKDEEPKPMAATVRNVRQVPDEMEAIFGPADSSGESAELKPLRRRNDEDSIAFRVKMEESRALVAAAEEESDEDAGKVEEKAGKASRGRGGRRTRAGRNSTARRSDAADDVIEKESAKEPKSASKPSGRAASTAKSTKAAAKEEKKTSAPAVERVRERRVTSRRLAAVREEGAQRGSSRRLRRESVNLRDSWALANSEDLVGADPRMQECMEVWRNVWREKISIPFEQPVQAKDAPGYFDVVKTPMDLSTVRNHLRDGLIKTPREFYDKMMLICNNAMLFNDVESDIYGLAGELRDLIRKMAKPIVRKWLAETRKEGNAHSSESSLSASEEEEEKADANELTIMKPVGDAGTGNASEDEKDAASDGDQGGEMEVSESDSSGGGGGGARGRGRRRGGRENRGGKKRRASSRGARGGRRRGSGRVEEEEEERGEGSQAAAKRGGRGRRGGRGGRRGGASGVGGSVAANASGAGRGEVRKGKRGRVSSGTGSAAAAVEDDGGARKKRRVSGRRRPRIEDEM